MSYDRPRPTLSARHADILTFLISSPASTKEQISEGIGGCCKDALGRELQKLLVAKLLTSRRNESGFIVYTVTPLGTTFVG